MTNAPSRNASWRAPRPPGPRVQERVRPPSCADLGRFAPGRRGGILRCEYLLDLQRDVPLASPISRRWVSASSSVSLVGKRLRSDSEPVENAGRRAGRKRACTRCCTSLSPPPEAEWSAGRGVTAGHQPESDTEQKGPAEWSAGGRAIEGQPQNGPEIR